MLSEAELATLLLSLKVSGVATLVGLPLSLMLGLLLARGHFRGRWLLDMLVHLPLVVPPVVIGFLLLLIFSPSAGLGSWLDQLGLGLAFSWRGAALAAMIMALPLMVRMIKLALDSEDPALAEASALLGCGRVRHFFCVSLPVIMPAIIGATVIGFARAFGEFGATITFAANIPGVSQTLPLALYSAAADPAGEAAALRLLVLTLIPAMAAIITSEWLARRIARRSRTGGSV